MATAACKKAISYLAENSGIIAALTQQQILTGDPDWALSRIKETRYDPSKGHNPRWIRVRTTPPKRVKYQPMLPQGNKEYTVNNPLTGEATAVQGDKTGRGCSLPAETIQYGYDVKNRCLMGKALEAGPWCVLDLLEKEAFRPLLEKLWTDLPRYAKEDFGRQLLRDVTDFSYYKFSIDLGFPMSVNKNYFPVEPKGGPSIGFFRKVETLMMAQGWAKGAGTPMIGGRSAIQVRMSRESIEWAIAQRKKELGMVIDTRQIVDDGVWGKTTVYEGIQFIEAALPTRGILRQVGATSWEFVELDPYDIVAADGEGFWAVPNEFFYQSHVWFEGQRYRVIEVAHIVHPMAMERQALGAIPAVKGKNFNRRFDFEVESIPDYELADRGCNKDGFYFGYRMLHAYAPLAKNPELMTAIMFLAPSNQYEVTDPWADDLAPAERPVTQAPLAQPALNACEPCEAFTGDLPRDPTDPTCNDLYPENGAGVISMRTVAYAVEETGGSITIIVDRNGGNVGAASVVTTTAEGTATNPENFTESAGSAGAGPWTKTLNWADGVFGPKTLVIPIVNAAGDDDGKQFTVTLSAPTGATLGTSTVSTVTILDEDGA